MAQEILNSFYGTIRIYCFNRAEMKFGTLTYSSNVFQTKNEKEKKRKKKAVEVEGGKEMEEGHRGRKMHN